MKKLKEWWWLLVPLSGLAVYLYSIKDKIFETAEQRTLMISDWKESPTPEQKQKAYLLDSLNDAHAVEIRQKRYDDGVRNDSIRAVKDSLVLDYVQKNAEQIYQIREELNKNDQ